MSRKPPTPDDFLTPERYVYRVLSPEKPLQYAEIARMLLRIRIVESWGNCRPPWAVERSREVGRERERQKTRGVRDADLPMGEWDPLDDPRTAEEQRSFKPWSEQTATRGLKGLMRKGYAINEGTGYVAVWCCPRSILEAERRLRDLRRKLSVPPPKPRSNGEPVADAKWARSEHAWREARRAVEAMLSELVETYDRELGPR